MFDHKIGVNLLAFDKGGKVHHLLMKGYRRGDAKPYIFRNTKPAFLTHETRFFDTRNSIYDT
jgi:hypothetical protein